MTKTFAEQIIDSMVDENGRCGERGLSEKQFSVLAKHVENVRCEEVEGWQGDYGRVRFFENDYEGTIGRYIVKLGCFQHFNDRFFVKSIEPWIDRLPDFSKSEHQGDPKKRLDLELTLIRKSSYDRNAYAYGTETVNIYTLADENDNCYVWKTTGYLEQEWEDEDGFIESRFAQIGDKIQMRATVKEHDEYKGIKQTILTRCKVNGIN